MTPIVILGSGMRGARLLQFLLLLQNRGRMTSADLARELEVSQRTILRDLDAMTEAGLPVITHQGNQGGIELGFGYRTRMTALDDAEIEALAVMLNHPHPALATLERAQAARRAAGKIIESQSETLRSKIAVAQAQFSIIPAQSAENDPRATALARAIRNRNIVTLAARSLTPRKIHPCALSFSGETWIVTCARSPSTPIPNSDWGDINISSRQFAPQE